MWEFAPPPALSLPHTEVPMGVKQRHPTHTLTIIIATLPCFKHRFEHWQPGIFPLYHTNVALTRAPLQRCHFQRVGEHTMATGRYWRFLSSFFLLTFDLYEEPKTTKCFSFPITTAPKSLVVQKLDGSLRLGTCTTHQSNTLIPQPSSSEPSKTNSFFPWPDLVPSSCQGTTTNRFGICVCVFWKALTLSFPINDRD